MFIFLICNIKEFLGILIKKRVPKEFVIGLVDARVSDILVSIKEFGGKIISNSSKGSLKILFKLYADFIVMNCLLKTVLFL